MSCKGLLFHQKTIRINMPTKKKSKKKASSVTTVNRSIAFSIKTAEDIEKISSQPVYRNNRSMAVESMVVSSPQYKRHSRKRSRKKQS